MIKAREQPAPLTVTVDEALKLSGLGRTTLYSLIKTNKVETVLIGRRRLIRFASLSRLLNEDAR